MALGARQRDVVTMILREAFSLVVAGIGVGLLAAFGVAHLIASQLYGVGPFDPLTLAGAGLVMIAATALAGYLPAQKASRVDPMIALRTE
jgi:ABC-type antimicrobial peptide transport system permease subunit